MSRPGLEGVREGGDIIISTMSMVITLRRHVVDIESNVITC